MRTNKGNRRRISFLAMSLALWGLVVCLQLFKVQVMEYTVYAGKIKAQTMRVMDLHSKRGTIYDRNGDILAISVKAKSAFISNKEIALSQAVFRRAGTVLSLSHSQQIKIARRIARGEKFIWLKRKLEDSEYRKLAALTGSGTENDILNFVDEYRRVYPQKRTASHVLGGVGIDEQPLGGVELSMDEDVRGQGGKIRAMIDARKKIFHIKYITEPIQGKGLYLTIDSSLQFIVEKELHRGMAEYNAKSGSVIVLDSSDGSVLAMANYPDFSPEEMASASQANMKNRAISFLYDPGSTFKIILGAAALENSVCRPQQVFSCFDGVYHVRDRTITDVHPFEQLSFEEIIVQSSNIGAARIGERIGRSRFFAAISAFGFGRRSGILLPGEESGILNPEKDWNDVSLAFISHGYEITVTPLQMALAFNVYAAGGYRYEPAIIDRVDRIAQPRTRPRRILRPQTLQQMNPILIQVVEKGTGKKARIPGLAVAGKTGTAQKYQDGRYSSDHISSFGGFFPVPEPRLTIFVVIDSPSDLYYGGDVAAPIFRSIAEKIMGRYQIFPESLPDGRIEL